MSRLTDALLSGRIHTALDLIHGYSFSARLYRTKFEMLYGESLLTARANLRSRWDKLISKSSYAVSNPQEIGQTPMQIAAERGYTNVIRALLNFGVSANIENASDKCREIKTRQTASPLQLAVLNGHEFAVRVLVDHGALVNEYLQINLSDDFDIPGLEPSGTWIINTGATQSNGGNAPRIYGATIMYLAVERCNISTISYLYYKASASIGLVYIADGQLYSNIHNDFSNASVLMRAVAARDDQSLHIIKFLLEKKLDVNKFIRRRWEAVDGTVLRTFCCTALSLALQGGPRKEKIAIELIKHGATLWPRLIDNNYEQPLNLELPDNFFWFEVAPEVEVALAKLASIVVKVPIKQIGYPLPSERIPIEVLNRWVPVPERFAEARHPVDAPQPSPPSALSILFMHAAAWLPNFIELVRRTIKDLQPDPDSATEIGKKLIELKRLDSEFSEDMLSERFHCAIAARIMRYPVLINESGHTYDREYIAAWLQQSNIDPKSGKHLSNKTFVENITVRQLIEEELDARIASARLRQQNPGIPIALVVN